MNTSGRSFRPSAIVCFDSLAVRPSCSRMTHSNRSTDMNSICSPQSPTARTPCHNKACWLRQFQPGCPARMTARKADLFWRSEKFASPIGISGANGAAADPGYRDSLAAYAAWRCHRPAARDALRGSCLRVSRSDGGLRTRAYGGASVDVGSCRIGMGCAWPERRRLATPSQNSAPRPDRARRGVLASKRALRRHCARQPTGHVVCRGCGRAV